MIENCGDRLTPSFDFHSITKALQPLPRFTNIVYRSQSSVWLFLIGSLLAVQATMSIVEYFEELAGKQVT